VLLALTICFACKAQIMSPYLAGQNGNFKIFYPYGFYTGNVINGFANGLGSFYWNDGSIFHGNFYGGNQSGPGVLISRVYGYVTGCWINGTYAGACQFGVVNPYINPTTVQNVVNNLQANIPASNPNNPNVTYNSYDPDGYRVVQVSPNTQMGQSMLGAYNTPH
jgi:hypothetical protein